MLRRSSQVLVLKWGEKNDVTKRLNYLFVQFTCTKGFISLYYQLTYFFEHDVTTQYNTTEQSQLDMYQITHRSNLSQNVRLQGLWTYLHGKSDDLINE